MYNLIAAHREQPTPRRETDLDRRFEDLRVKDAAFKAHWEAYCNYKDDLEYWCKWTQNGFDVGDRPARPADIPAAFEQDMLAFYRLAHA